MSLAEGDTLRLTFESAGADSGAHEPCFAVLERAVLPGELSGRRSPDPEPRSVTPIAFALRQNQPNPFRGRTTIRFELPVGAMVQLEVFDLQGRRLNTLANHYYPPGYHAVAWDHRTQSGASVGPGTSTASRRVRSKTGRR